MHIKTSYHQSWKHMRSLKNSRVKKTDIEGLCRVTWMSALINVDKFVHSALSCHDSKVLRKPLGDIFFGRGSKIAVQSVTIYHITLFEN